jgi:hypothetical protein
VSFRAAQTSPDDPPIILGQSGVTLHAARDRPPVAAVFFSSPVVALCSTRILLLEQLVSRTEQEEAMQRTLCVSAGALLAMWSALADASEPRTSVVERGRELVQATFHRNCESSGGACASPCSKCDTCAARIGELICKLETGNMLQRKWAAFKLGKYNWQQHPEIVPVLVHAMQTDCEPGVRGCAADALKKMKASDSETLAALEFSHQQDPSWTVRCRAHFAIKKGKHAQPPALQLASCTGCKSSTEPKLTPKPAPTLETPTPAPKPDMPEAENQKQTSRKFGSVFSTALGKVRSRL